MAEQKVGAEDPELSGREAAVVRKPRSTSPPVIAVRMETLLAWVVERVAKFPREKFTVGDPKNISLRDRAFVPPRYHRAVRWTAAFVMLALAACGRIGFDDASLTARWTFETTDALVFDPSEIRIDMGALGLVARDQTDDDNTPTGFGAGIANNVRWNGTMLELGAAGSLGMYRSQVFDAGGVVSWSGISWLPERPSGKPIPDDGSETQYPLGNLDRTGLRFLVHLDDTTGSIRDTSGNSNDGSNVGGTYAAAGRFGTAVNMQGTSYLDFGNASLLSVSGDLSISVWVKRAATAQLGFLISKEANPSPNGWCLFILSTDQVAFCIHDGQLRDTFTSTTLTSVGSWYHIVATHTPGAQQIYVNGVVQPLSQGGAYATNPAMSINPMWIGKRYDDTGYLQGPIDEVALFARTLSAAEVRELYYRGATRLRIQIRSCPDPTCAGIPFVGPGGSPTTFFVETAVAALPTRAITASEAPANRYFQYEMTFETDTSESPRVMSVRAEPAHVFAGQAAVTHTDAVALGRLVGFEETVRSTHTGTVRYQASPDGTVWYYRSGGRWAVATTLDDASTANEIDAGCDTFAPETGASTFTWRAIAHSEGGQQVVALDEVAVRYQQ